MENIKLDDNIINGKILKLNYPSLIKDEDINNLFLGLVKLIKRNIEFQVEKKYKETIKNLNKTINLLKLENKLLSEEINDISK